MDYSALVEGILALHRDSVGRAASAVNQTLVVRNWMIGGYLVEFEQKGSDRAAYGQGLLRRLSSDLSSRGVKGSSPDMLERMRLLFRHYPQLAAHISAPAVRIFPMSDLMSTAAPISAPAVRKSGVDSPAPLSAAMLLRLSWTHLADLVRIDDPWKRAFYENECLKGTCGDSFACWRPASMTASLFVDKPVRSDACANPRKPCPGAGDLMRWRRAPCASSSTTLNWGTHTLTRSSIV